MGSLAIIIIIINSMMVAMTSRGLHVGATTTVLDPVTSTTHGFTSLEGGTTTFISTQPETTIFFSTQPETTLTVSDTTYTSTTPYITTLPETTPYTTTLPETTPYTTTLPETTPYTTTLREKTPYTTTRPETTSYTNTLPETSQYPTGMPTQAPCGSGEFYNSSSAQCQVCPPGLYQDSCIGCSTVQYQQPDRDPESCEPCPRGHHQPASGQSECEECPLGFYQQYLGQLDCSRCPSGYNTTETAATDITHCRTVCEITFGSCVNGGVCNVDAFGVAVCGCSWTGYVGQRCDIDIDECVLTPGLCRNGGRCDNVPGRYECQCITQGGITYGGDNCTTVVEHRPSLKSLTPDHGPLAGGTLVTIRGRYFVSQDFRPLRVVLGGRYACDVTNSSATEIVAVTPESNETDIDRLLPVNVIFAGGLNASTPWNFTYLENPTITDLYPQNTILSGGTNVTVTGRALVSVATPLLEITIEIRDRVVIDQYNVITEVTKKTSSEACDVANASTALCPVPNILDLLPAELANYTITNDTIVDFDSQDRDVEFYIGVKLDGVQDYRNISNSSDPVLAARGILIVHSNPTFKDYTDEVFQYSESPLTFEGSDLRTVDDSEYVIEIGQGFCNDIEVADSSVRCQMPKNAPKKKPDSVHKYHQITLMVGLNQKYAMGFAHYEADIVLPISLAMAALALVVIIATAVCLKRKHDRRKKEADDRARVASDPDTWINLPDLPREDPGSGNVPRDGPEPPGDAQTVGVTRNPKKTKSKPVMTTLVGDENVMRGSPEGVSVSVGYPVWGWPGNNPHTHGGKPHDQNQPQRPAPPTGKPQHRVDDLARERRSWRRDVKTMFPSSMDY